MDKNMSATLIECYTCIFNFSGKMSDAWDMW